MYKSKHVQRAAAVAATAVGLLALGAGGAQASEVPASGGALGAVSGVTHGLQDTMHSVAGTRQTTATSRKPGHRTVRGVTSEVTGKTPAARAPQAVRKGAEQGIGKAATHGTQEAGAAVSTATSAATHSDPGAVPGLPATAAAPSAPGLPEDLVIGIPQLVPGVPSIGIVPASMPALPFTPTIPFL